MLTLSDDEVFDGDGPVPVGLRLHLRQCQSCRELSERLLRTTTGLERLAHMKPPGNMIAKANGHLLDALEAGLVPTGTAGHEVSSDTGDGAGEPRLRTGVARGLRRSMLLPTVRYVAAAAILILIALPPLWWAGYIGTGSHAEPLPRAGVVTPSGDQLTVDHTPPVRRRSAPNVEPAGPAVQRRQRLTAAKNDGPDQDTAPKICTFDSYSNPDIPEDADCIYRAFPLPRDSRRQKDRP